MGAIIPRTSPYEPCVRVSLHTAPDILRGLPRCSCGYNRDRIHGWQLGFSVSSCCDFRLGGVGVLVHHLYTSSHSDHMYGFGVLMP
jgi:hypothetical protein